MTTSYTSMMPAIRAARQHWQNVPRPVTPEALGPGEESVWDYPRPPRVEAVDATVRIEHAGTRIAQSVHALRVLETAGAPTIYVPPQDVRLDLLAMNERTSLCEWKGYARYYDLVIPGHPRLEDVAWTVPEPLDDLGQGYHRIAGFLSFYPGRLNACWLGEERVRPQPGGFYGGWVTDRIKGPIKGVPNSAHW